MQGWTGVCVVVVCLALAWKNYIEKETVSEQYGIKRIERIVYDGPVSLFFYAL